MAIEKLTHILKSAITPSLNTTLTEYQNATIQVFLTNRKNISDLSAYTEARLQLYGEMIKGK